MPAPHHRGSRQYSASPLGVDPTFACGPNNKESPVKSRVGGVVLVSRSLWPSRKCSPVVHATLVQVTRTPPLAARIPKMDAGGAASDAPAARTAVRRGARHAVAAFRWVRARASPDAGPSTGTVLAGLPSLVWNGGMKKWGRQWPSSC
jgi:hypothetical protein